MRIGVIILSRYNSTRLYGKALKLIGGKPVLQHVYDTLSQVFPAEDVVVATSENSTDDPIADYCEKNSISYFRGDLDNVALRFLHCAESKSFDYAIRINGDNFFIDNDLLRKVRHEIQSGNYDFITNVKDRTYPKGMSIEAVSVPYFKEALLKFCQDPNYCEHVTLYLYHHPPKQTKYFYNYSVKEAAGIPLALDTVEDFDRITRMQNLAKNLSSPSLSDIYRIYNQVENETKNV